MRPFASGVQDGNGSEPRLGRCRIRCRLPRRGIPIHRVTVATGGQPITGLRSSFPPDCRGSENVRIRELGPELRRMSEGPEQTPESHGGVTWMVYT